MTTPVILTYVKFYLPGHIAGGPIRAIANLVERLGEDFEFRIVTSDRDARDAAPYSGITLDAWNRVGKAYVYYESADSQTVRGAARIMTATPHDVLYLNSLFSGVSTVRPLMVRRLVPAQRRPTIVAPRGECAPSALALKRLKKQAFLAAARAMGLYRDVMWQASTPEEAEDIRRVVSAERLTIAPDLASAPLPLPDTWTPRPAGSPLRLVFLSRIAPMKNLDFALRVLALVTVPVRFEIYGPIADREYWQMCEAAMRELPPHISVEYKGPVEHQDVAVTLQSHDAFFLPTRGENWGHVIHEALLAAVPVLLSDRTPWKGLESIGVGWDLTLEDPLRFARQIERISLLGESDMRALRTRSVAYGLEVSRDEDSLEAHKRLFRELAAGILPPAGAREVRGV